MVDYVATHAGQFGVESIVEVLNEHGISIAASTYYAHAARGFGPSAVELDEAYAAHELYLLWVQNRRACTGSTSCGRQPDEQGSPGAATRSPA